MFRNAVFCLTIICAPALLGPLQIAPALWSAGTVSAQSLSQAELQTLGLESRWRSQAVMNVRRDAVTSVTNDEENVYVLSSSGTLTVFQAENGRKLWSLQVGRQDEATFPAVSNTNVVVVVAGPVIYGYNKFSGAELFDYRLPKQPTAPPAVSETDCFVPTDGGVMNAYSLAVLEYRTRYGVLPPGVASDTKWRFVTGEEIRYAPVISEKAIAFPTQANSLYSVETTGVDRGRTRVQVVLTKPVTAELATADSKDGVNVLMLTGDDRIFSVDIMKGNTEWTYPLGGSMTQRPVVVGPYVFVATTRGTLFKLDRDPGSLTWGRPAQVPQYKAPLLIGAGIGPAADDSPISGLQVKKVYSDTPAATAGLRAGDIITVLDGRPVETTDELRNAILELPLDASRGIVVNRQGKELTLQLQIPTIEWELDGISSLNTVGKYGVYGIDQAERLVGFDRNTGATWGRANIQGYGFHQHNSTTTQLFLASTSGEIVCLREIGPTIRMPEITTEAREAKIVKMHVRQGSGIDPSGTKICDVELPDGTVHEVTSDQAGVVRAVYVRDGQTVNINDRLILIADDSFATYHQRPEQRPVDVELNP